MFKLKETLYLLCVCVFGYILRKHWVANASCQNLKYLLSHIDGLLMIMYITQMTVWIGRKSSGPDTT